MIHFFLPLPRLSGVNMYAMLVGKLPFRSPRQGSKKRQKLLEQIQAGLTENREKDMSHVTPEGKDLIGQFGYKLKWAYLVI